MDTVSGIKLDLFENYRIRKIPIKKGRRKFRLVGLSVEIVKSLVDSANVDGY